MSDTFLNNYSDVGVSIAEQYPDLAGDIRPTTALNSIRPGDKKFASKTRAAMAREVWEDYQNRFEPYEQQLIDQVQNPEELLDERLSAITINNKAAFQSAEAGTDMMRQRYGVTPSGPQSRVENRDMQRSAVLSAVDGRNNTRTHVQDRNMAVIAGGGARQAIQET